MTRLIKKYKNRRLYDTEISQYITVEQLQKYVV
ncbi:polyhydroxyalkanoate synthesis regulator DNA-binding domain-containing protein, partial [Legionella pneumophila]